MLLIHRAYMYSSIRQSTIDSMQHRSTDTLAWGETSCHAASQLQLTATNKPRAAPLIRRLPVLFQRQSPRKRTSTTAAVVVAPTGPKHAPSASQSPSARNSRAKDEALALSRWGWRQLCCSVRTHPAAYRTVLLPRRGWLRPVLSFGNTRFEYSYW